MAKKEKVYKVISHAERKQRCSELEKVSPKDFSAFVEIVQEEYFEKDEQGNAVKKVVVVKKPVKGRNDAVRVADFSMNNIVAIGAEGTLKYSQYAGDIDKSLVAVNALMDRVDLDIANANVDKNISVEE